MKKNHITDGFTLIELLLTLGISSLLLLSALALPSYWVQQNRFMHHTARFLEALEFARSYAIITGTTVTVCSSDGSAQCGGSAYEKAWIVFTELPSSVNGTLDNNENILMVQHGNAEDLSIRSKTFTQSISYNRFGKANYNGRFILCAKQPERVVAELIVSQGRVRWVSHQDNEQSADVNNCLN